MQLLPVAVLAQGMVVMHATSYHISNRSLNESNPGIGVRLGNHYFLQAGRYRNSNNDYSDYVMVGGEVAGYKSVRLNLVAGVVDGYRDAPEQSGERENEPAYLPFLIPEIDLDLDFATLLIHYIPRYKDENRDQAIGVSVGFKF
jgi:hypothetical protein